MCVFPGFEVGLGVSARVEPIKKHDGAIPARGSSLLAAPNVWRRRRAAVIYESSGSPPLI